MSDLDRLLQQVEELKKLANRPDDSWMDNMSNEELQALGKRVRKVADGLSGLQGQLQRQVPSNPMKPLIPTRSAPQGAGSKRRAGTSGSLGSMVKREQGSPAPAPQQANEGIDLSNPMQRRRHAPPPEAPSAPPRPQPPAPQRPAGETPPPSKHGGRRPNF
ncbi:MAG: hypothetical protein QOH66_2059 [Actinomycetota bacterium]|nr:hypothetical protein [Actinomycetota bacterium]